ncbi:MAG: transcriptional repressor [Thermodesulfobacteriota bacterium]
MIKKCLGFCFPFGRGRQGGAPCCARLGGDNRHALEREQFEAVLRSFNASRIEERLVILDIFLSIEQHVTLAELMALIRERQPALADQAFVRETMEMFCQCGFAQQVTFENQEARYEHHHLGQHHDHFVCTRCGQIQEFRNEELERLQRVIARQFRFHPLQHRMEIYGLCAGCMALRDDVIPLRMAANGERVRIVQLLGDRAIQARLADLGLTLDTCLEVINNQPAGPTIVAINTSRLAIDGDIARHVVVAHACRLDDI